MLLSTIEVIEFNGMKIATHTNDVVIIASYYVAHNNKLAILTPRGISIPKYPIKALCEPNSEPLITITAKTMNQMERCNRTLHRGRTIFILSRYNGQSAMMMGIYKHNGKVIAPVDVFNFELKDLIGDKQARSVTNSAARTFKRMFNRSKGD